MKKQNRRICGLILFLTIILLSAYPVVALGATPGTQADRQLVIATADNGPISIERLLFNALRDIRYSVDFVSPIVREGYVQANDGICDGVIAGYPDLHSAYTNLIQVPVPLENINVRVFAAEGSELRINGWDELGGLRVGILENRTYILERLPENATITEKLTNRAVLNGIVDGEYDVAVLTERDHETLGEGLRVLNIGQVDQLTEYLYVNKKHEALIPQLADALSKMFSDGSADLILNDLPLPDRNQKKTVVHIVSSSIETGREDQFNAALRRQFENDMSVEWMTVDMDAKRFSRGQHNIAHIAALLRADCVPRNVVAVIVSGDTALDFLKDYYYLYFRNVPVLFYGVSERYREIVVDNEEQFTGIVLNIEAYQTMEAALSIFPETRNVFVVNDYTEEGIQYRAAIEAELKAFETRLNIEYNDNLNGELLLARIDSLPEDSLVLIGSYFVDSDHQYYSTGEMKRLMERYCSVPVLTVYSTDLAYNAIGGKCPDYRKYGEEIGGMLQKLFNGAAVEEIPVILDSTADNRWVFDKNLMDAFGIKPNALPHGAEILNTIPSIRESNRQFFIALMILAVVSALLIIGSSVFLIANHRHNKHKNMLQKELAVEKEAAQSASRAKSSFLANMSHEMRTPLTTVLGMTELTLNTAQLDDETYLNLVKIHRAGETLLYLINDILDISKIEADRLELNLSEYGVPSMLNDTITQSVLYLGEKPVEFVLDIKEDLPSSLYGDELRIKQILNNLLSNAFKFTKEGTVELGVRCEHDGDAVWLTAWVRDTGVGIRQEDMGKLFTLYAKMEDENNPSGADRRTEGSGLGLSIAKKVAEMMEGSINVESEYGKGSVFTVRLKQKHVSEKTIGPNVAENLKKHDYSLHKIENARTTRLNMSYASVLVVDDNPTNLDVTKRLIGLYGINADCVTSGQQAIDAIRGEKVKYDAIFMDHMMPEMDGIEAARIIREELNTEYAKTIPIIALTANAIVGNEEMFLDRGFQAFISKPIGIDCLDDVLMQWVRDAEEEARLPERMIYIEGRSGEQEWKFSGSIPGVDVGKGIEHYGRNKDAFYKLLRSYVSNTRKLLDSINEVSRDDLRTYAVTIHGIKGSSRGIFAMEAGDEAEALENAAAAGYYDYVSANNLKFLDTINRLISDIEEALESSGVERKPIKDKPEGALLDRLLEASGSFDIDGMDAAMAEMEKYTYTSDDGLSAWLREKIDKGEYVSIKERLSKYQEEGMRP